MARKKKQDLTYEVLQVALLEKCRQLGARSIHCEYDGGGDDGQLNDPTFDTGDVPAGVTVTWFKDSGMTYDAKRNCYVMERSGAQEVELKEALHRYCYDHVEQHFPGDWVNNEGGFGELVVDISQHPPKITLDANQRVQSVDHYKIDCVTGEVIEQKLTSE